MSVELAGCEGDCFFLEENEDGSEVGCDVGLAPHFFDEFEIDADKRELSNTLSRALILDDNGVVSALLTFEEFEREGVAVNKNAHFDLVRMHDVHGLD